jgi:hypothetical protein
MNEKLSEENFLLFCAKHYDNSRYTSTEEFIEDLNRIKYIKKLITRYVENKDLKERLILNHIIILNNCFGPEVLCKILYLKLKTQMKYIKPFLILLNVLPSKIYNVENELVIDTNLIETDLEILKKLRKI